MCIIVPRKTCPTYGQGGKGHDPYTRRGSDTINCGKTGPLCERIVIGDTKGKKGDCEACVLESTYEQRKTEGNLTEKEKKAEKKKDAKIRLKLDVEEKRKKLWPSAE